jgi:peptidoglycan/LPS O-acetylase OafA/YrhL
MPGPFLNISFLCGVVFYLYKDRITWSYWIFIASIAFIYILFSFSRGTDIFSVPALAYVTVFLGLTSPKKHILLQGADYSYGVFLYGYPIQQALAYFGGWSLNWMLNGLVASVAASAFAAFSWRFVEKPALNIRKYILLLEEVILEFWEDTRRKFLAIFQRAS